MVFKQNRGFTLVEVLIAMAIFVVFVTTLLSAYTNIVQGQRKANEYRRLYSESREIFDEIIFNLRDKAVDYGLNGALESALVDQITLLNKDGSEKLTIGYDGEKQEVFVNDGFQQQVLNNQVKVEQLRFFVTPVANPYNAGNFDQSASQFQPKVTVYGRFVREINGGEIVTVDLQTTVSSRLYNEVINNDVENLLQN